MACWNWETWRTRWRGVLSNKMVLCLCGEKEASREQEEKMYEGSDRDKRGSGEENVVRITVEDLGTVNRGFSLADEDPVTPKSSEAHSETTWIKKQLEVLTSLSVQLQVQPTNTHTIEEEEEDLQLLSDEGTPGSGVLPMTLETNRIPPTPSTNDGNLFFCSNSGEGMMHACGAGGDEEGRVKSAEESWVGCVLLDQVLTAEAEGEPEDEDGQNGELAEQNETEPLEKWDKDEFKPKLSWSAQLAPVCFGKKKSEYRFYLIIKNKGITWK